MNRIVVMGQCVLSVGTSIEDITAWYCIPQTNHRPFILYASFMWHYSYYLFYWGGNIIQRHVYCVYIHYRRHISKAKSCKVTISPNKGDYYQETTHSNWTWHIFVSLMTDIWWLHHRTIKIKLLQWNYMNRMRVWAMFTTLMKNKHWPNLHWPLCLENKPGQPRSWSNLPSLPTKYSHLVVFVTEQNKCWHMVSMNVDTRSV